MYNTDGKGKVWDRETGEIKIEIPMNEFDKWIAALRSGKYTQTKGRLQDSKGFCCLGVACDITIPEHKRVFDLGYISGIMPNEQPEAPIWIKEINSIFYEINKRQDFLFDLNDTIRLSFEEIADVLELTFKECAFNE